MNRLPLQPEFAYTLRLSGALEFVGCVYRLAGPEQLRIMKTDYVQACRKQQVATM